MAEPASAPSQDSPPPSCARCKSNPATIKLRADLTCPLGLLRKELVGPREKRTCKYVAGLSFGPSSTALVHVLDENLRYVRARANSNSPAAYDLVVVHVDTDLRPPSPTAAADSHPDSAATLQLQRYRERFPDLEFQLVPLSYAFGISSIDWSSLPSTDPALDPQARMQALFDALPSVTSRADILRLLIRHILLSVAADNSCEGLLLGCTTTALAELTLSELARGKPPRSMQIYYPLRDIFRNEIHTFLRLADPPLTGLAVANPPSSAEVVSHKDLSIEEAMVRYFESVEEGYPAVVANVVRTTGRLTRAGAVDAEGEQGSVACGLCGMAVDESGDARWKGEIGVGPEEEGRAGAPLCYGCERSIRG
ncbi:unnamed protein product [Parascedosporium putredinis]|uniref:Cytoplasmic tRNA 2-thiolation protein 2 n=1 Tax=Parascedosporium putredinis TaxID=1442378 RepID=A0A9P1MDR3_9PEZI|nr:unnamed protein product [Parascedosporium putredinis]CAI8001106.1 unnamed protein product [Parascedosporium putredinis]